MFVFACFVSLCFVSVFVCVSVHVFSLVLYGKVSWEKKCCSFGFCPIYLHLPHPLPHMKRCQKIWAGPSPHLDKIQKNNSFFSGNLPLPKFAHLQIIYKLIRSQNTCAVPACFSTHNGANRCRTLPQTFCHDGSLELLWTSMSLFPAISTALSQSA